MTTPSTTSPDTATATARELLRRWDAQQTGYVRHRAERFATIARVVAAVCAGTAAPRVLDLAGGPGSLGAAVRREVPAASVVVVDKDPLLLQLAADATADDPLTTTALVDLADPAWVEAPALSGAPFDAVVSSTALHWLQPDALVRVYGALPGLMRPGGVVLNGDHLQFDATTQPVLRAVALRDDEEVQRAAFAPEARGGGGADTWDAWWAAASAAHPDRARERDAVWGEELHVAPPKVTAGFHLEALRSAGFRETGEVWRYLDDVVVCGVL